MMYILPPGKPDTTVPLVSVEEDLRPRVDLSSAKKGQTCFYYALNLIRTRIGPNPPPEYQEARRIEKCISDCRKQITQIDIVDSWNKLKTVETLVQTALQHCKAAPNANSMKGKRVKIFQALNAMGQKLSTEYKPCLEKAKELINTFCKQSACKNIYTYIQNAQMASYYSIFQKYAAELGCDLKEMHQRHVEDIFKTMFPETYRTLSQEHKAIVLSKLGMKALLLWDELIKNEPSTLDTFFQEAAAEAYGFRKSSWTPYQPIESLIESLKSNGPHCVTGFHGSSWYRSPPAVQQTIEGRSIYGWDSSDRLPESSSSAIGAKSLTSHTIVIIGADKAGGIVYFIDPNDGSSVKDPEQQKIYAIPYQSLTEHHDCLNIVTLRTKDYQPSAGYALYYPK
ncbi:MAG: hypothetical protein JSR93_08585 [Verrucomicrobia bacterium]|nr:hypothetical protein [Verrucomicrobiota bacterium]